MRRPTFTAPAALRGALPASAQFINIDLATGAGTPSQAVEPGETWLFQLWFRDPNPQPTSTFTQGAAFTFS